MRRLEPLVPHPSAERRGAKPHCFPRELSDASKWGLFAREEQFAGSALHRRTLDFALMVEIVDAAVIIMFCSQNIPGSLQFYRIFASFFPYSCLLLKKKKVVGFDRFFY